MTASPNVSGAVEDEELDQLVSDIEELREAMSLPPRRKSSRQPVQEEEGEPEVRQAPAEPGSVSDFHASGDEPSMEETLADLKEEEDSAPQGRSLLDEPVEAAPGEETAEGKTGDDVYEAAGDEEDAEGGQMMKESGEDGSLTMTVRGNMTLKLKYECDGQEVMVGVQGNTLVVQLADGTEFKIPVRRAGSSRLKAVG